MSEQSLYDADILLWSEQQAEVIRRLGRARRDISNELDVENVAEEIESVGRSELAAVKSGIRQIFLHMMKLFAEPDSNAARHWRGEIAAFHSEMTARYAPSMWQRIDVNDIWASALHQMKLAHEGEQEHPIVNLPTGSPFSLDDLLTERVDVARLLQRLTGAEPA